MKKEEKKELGPYGYHKKGTASGGGFIKGKFVHTNASNPKSKALHKAKEEKEYNIETKKPKHPFMKGGSKYL